MRERLMLLSLGVAHSLNHSFFLVLPPLLEMVLRSTGATIQAVGLVTTWGYSMYGVGALVAGALANKVGEGRLITLSTGLAGASTLIIYAVPTVTGLGVGFFIMAVWASLYHPMANSLISKVFQAHRGTALGFHGAVGSIGQVAAPTVAVIIGAAFGWNSAFLFFGSLALFTSLLLSRLPNPGRSGTYDSRAILRTFTMRGLWILFAHGIIGGLLFRGVEFILPLFLYERRGLSVELAGGMASLLLAFGVLGQLLGGRSIDTIGSKRMLVISAVGVLLGLLMLTLIPYAYLGVGLFLLLYGVFVFASQPASVALTASITSSEARGAVYGVTFFLTFGVGGVAVALVGQLSHMYGLDAVISAVTLFALLSMLTAVMLPSERQPPSKGGLGCD